MAYAHKVMPGARVRLSDYDPGETGKLAHNKAGETLAALGTQLTSLQESLYAAAQNSVLIVLQGLDTAGKDGTISHVMASSTPWLPGGGLQDTDARELAHDFLWRVHQRRPGEGHPDLLFNRSYYEDVLVVRVHDLVARPPSGRNATTISTTSSRS